MHRELNRLNMELDQTVLQKLSAQERQKINRQLRQRQVEGYLKFVKEEKQRGGGSIKKPCRPNKKKTKPNFCVDLMLQDAVENFDDKEVSWCLQKGTDHNFTTGNGTSLLHKCSAEDNAGTAAILISHGADVNILDDDWWTPLHTACSCDSTDMVQLLLNNGADVSLVDVDGFFPIDHCQDGSETQQIMARHMETQGLNEEKKKEIQLSRPRQMYKDIQHHLNNGGSPNKVKENGVSLLHIASANGYRKVLKLLIKHGAEINIADNLYWTPLHVAARFSQMDTVKTLIKNKANVNAIDIEGNKPSAVAGSNEIRALMLKRERKTSRGSVSSELDVKEETDEEEEEEPDGLQGGVIIRINSKTVKPRHSSVGKMDSLLEGKNLVNVMKVGGQTDEREFKNISTNDLIDQTIPKEIEAAMSSMDMHEDEEEEIYVSKIWKTAESTQVNLPAVEESDNLKDLSDISEEAVLTEIHKRYTADQIYTKIGDVLLAVNPFKNLTVFGKQVSASYHKTTDLTTLPPHVYTTAEEAYRQMMSEEAQQCCVISGESGAGKTETSKLLVQHLSRVTGSEEANLNNKINQVGPLLEAFGNAQTVINDNSSRFAKYIELMFNYNGKMVGAKLTEYLLEKSRVVYQNEGERNFHIFYWMFSGLTPEECNLFHLKSTQGHRYVRSRVALKQSEIQDNKEKFWDLKKCLGFVGFTSDDIQNLLLTLAAVIHIGDITFCPHSNNDAAVITNPGKIEEVSVMLDISPEELSSALVAEYTITRGEQIKKDRTVQQASDCRDALAKAIYSRLFSWIVNGINQLVEPVYQSPEQMQIGILDIFGFENFKMNSFEQICINLANEQMQNFTNEHLFYKEQQDCLLEGIQLVDLNYKNNQEIIDTFMERHTGVFAILDEESRFPKATDLSLAAKLHQGPGKKFSSVYKSPKDGGHTFTIVHYAGAVSYNLQGTLDKNRDTLPNAIIYTMKTSNSLLIKELFQSKITRTGSLAPSARQQRSRKGVSKSPFEFFKKLKAGKTERTKNPVKAITASERKGPATMAYHFKCSLSELMSKIQRATPHIIRCLKPNTTKSPETFIGEYVLAQLRYTGIAETIKIKKFGYSVRIKFHDFVNRYKALVFSCLPFNSMIPDVEKVKEVFKYCILSEKDGFKIGKTKVFMTEHITTQVDKANSEILKKIIVSQSAVRRRLAYGIFKQKKDSAEMLRVQTVGMKGKQRSEKERVTSEIMHTFDDLENMIDSFYNDDLYEDAITYVPYKGPLPEFPPDDNVDMNGHVQYRGLPAPPGDFMFEGDGMPPPCPREMYSQGVYDVIPGDPHAPRRQRKPQTPQRSPSTRLSSQSANEEVFSDHPQSPRQHGYPQSPRQAAHHSQSIAHQQHILSQQPTSPKMKKKHGPQPDPTQSKPFSYFGPGGPPKPGHKHPEGQYTNQRVPSDSNYESVDISVHQNGRGSAGYGYDPHHSGGQGHTPGSPVAQRQSSITRTASISPKLSRRNQSPQAVNTNQRLSGPRGPPSFPAPTAPGNPRAASPPLPPPPGPAAAGYDQPPPPPPIEKIPGHQSVSSFEIGKKRRQSADTDVNRNQVQDPRYNPQHQGYYQQGSPQHPDAYIEQIPQKGYGAGSPYQQPHGAGSPYQQPFSASNQYQQQPHGAGSPYQQQPHGAGSPYQQQQQQQQQYYQQQQQYYNQQQNYNQQSSNLPHNAPSIPVSSGGLAEQLNKVKLKPGRSGAEVTPQAQPMSSEEKACQLAAELGKVKLKPAKAKESGSPPPEKQQDSPVGFLSKLKPTGAKPWEKDPSPEQQVQPEIPSEPDQFDDDYFPPPPPDLTEISEPVNGVQTGSQPKPTKGNSAPSLSSKMADIEIDLSTIDYSQIPGYTPITAAVPNWKRDMIEKKNQEKLNEYIIALRRRKEEEEKWKNVPEWKRKILMEKAAMKDQEDQALDAAKKQKEKKKFESPDQVKLKPVKSKPDSQSSMPESPPQETKETKPLQEIKQNVPIPEPKPKVAPVVDVMPPPPPPQVEVKPKKKISVPDIDPMLPPPPPPDVMDDVDQVEERRRREEKRREIESQMEEEDTGDLPAWKKEIMMKRGGVPKNWGDEREDINDLE